MESEARRTGRAHEHELCPEFAHSARQHRPAEHSRRAVSTCSRADYEKSDGQCHARLWVTEPYTCWRTYREFGFSFRDCSPLNATLHRSVLVRAPPNSIARIDSAVKNRAMNRTKIFAILVGTLNAAVPVRGQDNLEPDCRGNVRPLLPQNSSEAALP
jgi:hypothetical protein